MLEFLHPLWLTAMAAALIPVLLHLWNDRQGKVLRIGSIHLLEAASKRQSWSRRLSEWWLLVVRCLLLLVLALLLAGPVWRPAGPADPTRGWVLEEQSGDSVLSVSWRPLIDSLLKAGYERHWLDGKKASYWSLFREMDRIAPAGIPFYIFTPARSDYFRGERPVSDRPVRWYPYSLPDSASHWIEAAWLTPGDSIRVVRGDGRATGTAYTDLSLAARPGAAAGNSIHVDGRGGKWTVSMDGQTPLPVNTEPLRIAIYADPAHSTDGRYLAAALRALGQFTRKKITLTMGKAAPTGTTDWLFWLSPQPLTAGLEPRHLFIYETGREKEVETRVDEIEWTKEIEMPEAAGSGVGSGSWTPIWTDGYGRAVLAMELNKEGDPIYHFFSRLDPQWNGLVWSPSLPIYLEGLLFGSDSRGTATFGGARDRYEGRGNDQYERRVLDPTQILPLHGKAEQTGATTAALSLAPAGGGASAPAGFGAFAPAGTLPGGASPDGSRVGWCLLVSLFILERLIAFRTSKEGKKK